MVRKAARETGVGITQGFGELGKTNPRKGPRAAKDD